MKSRQINFFAMPDEWAPLEKYLEENDMICVASKSESKEITPEKVSEKGLFKFFVRKEHVDSLKIDYFKETKMYCIDETYSPVIQFTRSFHDNNKSFLRRSRFYYTKGFWNKNEEWVEKPKSFLDNADKLFKWFKKNYKLEQHPDYKLIYLTTDVKNKFDNKVLDLEMY